MKHQRKIHLIQKMRMALIPWALCGATLAAGEIEKNFVNPPDSARPGVYWNFLNGNLNGVEMTTDLESMKAAGLGNLIFLEVDIGEAPAGPVAFMSPKWQELFVKSVRDAERLGIDISLGIGPGWCGSGGHWVKPEQAMLHLGAKEHGLCMVLVQTTRTPGDIVLTAESDGLKRAMITLKSK